MQSLLEDCGELMGRARNYLTQAVQLAEPPPPTPVGLFKAGETVCHEGAKRNFLKLYGISSAYSYI